MAVYASNGKTIGTGDSLPAALMPIALVLDGTPMLGRFRPVLAEDGLPYFVHETPYGLASWYPSATGLIATPIVAPLVLWFERTERPDARRWLEIGRRLEKVAATLVAAASVVTFHAVCRALAFSRVLALVLTLLFAFGSQTFSTSSQALWQHGPGTFALVGALWLLLGARGADRTAPLAGFATLAALAVAIRPSNLLLVAPFGLLALCEHPCRWLVLVVPPALVGAALLAYNLALFGHATGGYGAIAGFSGDFARGLLGVLLSPGRGLLVYFPVTALLVALLVVERGAYRDGFAVAGLAGIGATIVLVATWRNWWGGYSFGPRLLGETQPLILLLVGIGVARGAASRRRGLVGVLVLLLPVQAFVQALGTYGPAGQPPAAVMWNASPVSVDEAPERNWSVLDSPIARALRR